jgi:hypothetical protein
LPVGAAAGGRSGSWFRSDGRHGSYLEFARTDAQGVLVEIWWDDSESPIACRLIVRPSQSDGAALHRAWLALNETWTGHGYVLQ